MSLTDCCHCCFNVFHVLCDFKELSPMFEMSMIRSQHLCRFPVIFKGSRPVPTDDYKCRCLFVLNSTSNKFHASEETDLRFYLYRGGLHNTFRESHWLKEWLLRIITKYWIVILYTIFRMRFSYAWGLNTMCSIFPHQKDCHFKHSRTPIKFHYYFYKYSTSFKGESHFQGPCTFTTEEYSRPVWTMCCVRWQGLFFGIIHHYLGHQKAFFHRGPNADELPL